MESLEIEQIKVHYNFTKYYRKTNKKNSKKLKTNFIIFYQFLLILRRKNVR